MQTAQLPTLPACLTQQPWRQLLARMAAHGLVTTAQQRKADLVQQLLRHLQQPAILSTIITQLSPQSQMALQALLAAGGQLPCAPFEQQFGPLRAYRPWQKAADEQAEPAVVKPWLAPISATEQLWYIGLIYRHPAKPQPGQLPHYVLPLELYQHWAAQPSAHALTPVTATPILPPGRPADWLIHLGVWLATLNGDPSKPLRGGWLPPTTLAHLQQRLGLEEAPPPLRSERHDPYLAFLHYLALAADLATVTPTALQLTPAAWAWLQAPPALRRQQIFAAWRAAPPALAQPFHFPWASPTPQSGPLLLEQIGRLSVTHWLPLANLLQQLRLQDVYGRWPAPHPATWYDDSTLIDPLAELCQGPLLWLGLVELAQSAGGELAIRLSQTGRWLLALPDAATPAFPPAAACTVTKAAPETLAVPFHGQPLHLAHLARLCHWAPPTAGNLQGYTLTLDPTRVAQAASQGLTVAQILQQVTAALGRPPSRRLGQQLRRWAQQGQQVQIRPLLVLETATPALLAQLRRHKLVRRRLGEGLAPNRVALNPLDVAALLQTLRTLGHHVAAPAGALTAITDAGASFTADPAPAAAPKGLPAPALSAAWQWLLLRLYEQLGQFIDLPLTPPWSIRQALSAQLAPLQRAAAEAAADQLVQQIAQALDGYLALPPWAITADPDRATTPIADLLPLLQAAITAGHDLTLHYAGASRGNLTTRRVTPFRLEERHGVPYLIAWCHLRQAERVFRVDRVVAVEQSGSP